MSDISILESRWQDIQDSRPRARNQEPKEGSTGFAYLMWANNSVERVRVLNRNRDGTVCIQRMVPSVTQHDIELNLLRSDREATAWLEQHHPEELKNLDVPRLPRGILMKMWGR